VTCYLTRNTVQNTITWICFISQLHSRFALMFSIVVSNVFMKSLCELTLPCLLNMKTILKMGCHLALHGSNRGWRQGATHTGTGELNTNSHATTQEGNTNFCNILASFLRSWYVIFSFTGHSKHLHQYNIGKGLTESPKLMDISFDKIIT